MEGGYDERTICHSQKVKADHLILRAKLGMKSDKFRDVDYNELLRRAREKKARANASYHAMKRITQTAKKTKESNLMTQHRRVWHQEFLRLEALKKRLKTQVDHFVDNPAEDCLGHVLLDLYEYLCWLNDQTQAFQYDTVKPVWDLRQFLIMFEERLPRVLTLSEDVCFWNYRFMHEPMAELSDPDDIRDTIDSVSQQQKNVLQRLGQEQETLEMELGQTVSELCLDDDEESFEHGIPEEAMDLDCPSDDLKAKVLQEFLVLDEKYMNRFLQLEDNHRQYIDNPCGGWPESDHATFSYVSEQYTSDVPNRAALCIDLLRRHLPHYSTQQFVEHDAWVTFTKHYHNRRRAVLTDWIRDRTELLNRAKVVFKEAWESKWRVEDLAESRRQQEEHCHALYEKVLEWRRQKEELKLLEQEEEQERQAELLQQQALLQHKEKQRRDNIKKKIEVRKEHFAAEERRRVVMRARRLEYLRQQMEEQAERDRERVAYREGQTEKKRELRMLKEEEIAQAQADKEKRLEDLRKQCRVEAEPDFDRLAGETESWKLRREGEELVNIQQPLYKNTGFTAQQNAAVLFLEEYFVLMQHKSRTGACRNEHLTTLSSLKITSDQRVRAEVALREAGLLNRQYAREKLASIHPPTQPRPDTFSTVFK